jgi:hypothetical protein
MAFEFLTDFLLIKPKPGDSEETAQQKSLINHAIQTYFQFSAAEKIGDTLLSQFIPKQVLINKITQEGMTPEDLSTGASGIKDVVGIAKLLGARKFMPFF